MPAVVAAEGHIGPSPAELTFGPLARSQGAVPGFNRQAATCEDVYCHGSTGLGPHAGGAVSRTPRWTQVDGTHGACGTACHTNPPGGWHPDNTACQSCHDSTLSAYDVLNPSASTWADASLHINGQVELSGARCTECHGDAASNDPAPPLGEQGETATSEPAVGAHRIHLASSSWHRTVECADCHVIPTTAMHQNNVVDFSWGGPSAADGATPSYDASMVSCAGTYCHGSTLLGPTTGGTVARVPVWTQVDGTFSACGSTCHTNPPGGSHPDNSACESCHGGVVSSYNPLTLETVWADKSLHINGSVEGGGYHDLSGWTSPRDGADHHGSNYFLTNQQRDEHDQGCTLCHGTNLDGGTSGVSCDNATCHGTAGFRSCSFCHGSPPTQSQPPVGVGGETTPDTLAVGRHGAHLSAGATHTVFACTTCHAVPATGDLTHAIGYQPSGSLASAGHHGDVAFSGTATTGMAWNVGATQGSPVTARGTCVGGCHSNGNGGAPAVTPYWAGGTWTSGSCTSCHPYNLINTGRHEDHLNKGMVCSDCHPPASSGTHVNGVKDYTGAATIFTGSPCGSGKGCMGSCHGEGHSSECWN